MKKKLFIGLSLFLVSSSLVGCGESEPYVSPETIELTRQFVSSMQKDVNDFNNQVYKSSFSQKYSIEYVSETTDEITNCSLDYQAEGEVTSGYYLASNDIKGVTPAKIFKEGIGYFAGKQQEVAKLTHLTTAKTEKGKERDFKADYTFKHDFGVQFDGDKLYALGVNELTNRLNSENPNPVKGEFYGSLDRKDGDGKPVITQYGEELVEETISRILYLESWTTISKFKEATVKYFQDLDLSNDNDAKRFVIDKQVQVREYEGLIKVNFVLDGNKVLQEITGKDLEINAQIKGSAEINKTSKFVNATTYDFKDLLAATLSKGDKNKRSYNVSVEKYSLNTNLVGSTANQMKLDGEFTQYATTQSTEFMNNFKKYVVPSLDNVEVDESGAPVNNN